MAKIRAILVAVIDKQTLFRKGLVSIINSFAGINVIVEADNSIELSSKLKTINLPDICILSTEMSFAEKKALDNIRKYHPSLKILLMAEYQNDYKAVQLIHSGIPGYLLKDSPVNQLRTAIKILNMKGFYIDEKVTDFVENTQNDFIHLGLEISDLQLEFLSLCGTGMTSREIADKMGVGIGSINTCSKTLFKKIKVKNRIGLVLFAISCGIAGQISYEK